MSRHTARRRALEILFSREFHDVNDIQYSETEILENNEGTPAAAKKTFSEIDAAELDANAVNVNDIEEVPTDAAEDNGDADTEAYCAYLIGTVSAHADELDGLIRAFAKGWDLRQMNMADKTTMRLALCEFVYPKEELAPAIIINEAVRLAKECGGPQSSRFVNGILGAYARSLP